MALDWRSLDYRTCKCHQNVGELAPLLFFLIFQTSSSSEITNYDSHKCHWPNRTNTRNSLPTSFTQHRKKSEAELFIFTCKHFLFFLKNSFCLVGVTLTAMRGFIILCTPLRYWQSEWADVYSPCEDGKLRTHDVKSCEKQAKGW